MQSLSLHLFLVSGLKKRKIHIGRIDLVWANSVPSGELTFGRNDLIPHRRARIAREARGLRLPAPPSAPLSVFCRHLRSTVKDLFCGIIYVWVYSTDTYLYPCIKLSNSGCGTEKRISGGFWLKNSVREKYLKWVHKAYRMNVKRHLVLQLATEQPWYTIVLVLSLRSIRQFR